MYCNYHHLWLAFRLIFIISLGHVFQSVLCDPNGDDSTTNQNRDHNNTASPALSLTQPLLSGLRNDNGQLENGSGSPHRENSQSDSRSGGELSNGYNVFTSNQHSSSGPVNGARNQGWRRHLPITDSHALDSRTNNGVVTNQASIPTTRASLPSNLARMQQLLDRRRDRQRRVLTITQNILRNTGHTNRLSTNGNTNNRRVALAAWSRFNSQHPNWRPPRQTENHCYRAVCSLPESTNTILWSSDTEPVLRLFFSVPRLNRRGELQQRELEQARLKLFVHPRRECPCPDNTPNGRPVSLQITVYQFIRPLSYRKRNRIVYRRQFLDRMTVPGEGNLWVGLNVMSAVSLWMNRSRRNFGLEVTVSYTNGTLLDAREVLSLPRCEGQRERSCREDNNQPIERILRSSLTLEDDTEPYIDVITRTKVHLILPFNRTIPFPLSRLRTARSVSSSSSPSGNVESRTSLKLMQKSPRLIPALVGNSKNVREFKQEKAELNERNPLWNKFLEKLHRKPSVQNRFGDCICDPNPNGPDPDNVMTQRHENRDQNDVTSERLASSLSKALWSSRPMVSKAHQSCRGKRVSVDIKDLRVLAPRSYTTLICPKACRVCSEGKCRYHTCKPVRHRKLRAVVMMPSGKISSQILPGLEFITSCGC